MSGFGCGGDSSCLWILILLCCCGNGIGGTSCGGGCGGGCGDSSWLWILILLCCCGGCGNQIGNCNTGCGC